MEGRSLTTIFILNWQFPRISIPMPITLSLFLILSPFLFLAVYLNYYTITKCLVTINGPYLFWSDSELNCACYDFDLDWFSLKSILQRGFVMRCQRKRRRKILSKLNIASWWFWRRVWSVNNLSRWIFKQTSRTQKTLITHDADRGYQINLGGCIASCNTFFVKFNHPKITWIEDISVPAHSSLSISDSCFVHLVRL